LHLSNSRDVKFTINGNDIESMQSWSHVGHIISSDMDDDIDRSRHKLIGQVNIVLCSFHQADFVIGGQRRFSGTTPCILALFYC